MDRVSQARISSSPPSNKKIKIIPIIFWKIKEILIIFWKIKKIPTFFFWKIKKTNFFFGIIKKNLIIFWKITTGRHATPHHHRINRFRALPPGEIRELKTYHFVFEFSKNTGTFPNLFGIFWDFQTIEPQCQTCLTIFIYFWNCGHVCFLKMKSSKYMCYRRRFKFNCFISIFCIVWIKIFKIVWKNIIVYFLICFISPSFNWPSITMWR